MLQSTALDYMLLGHNVYMTGSAGSGKSYTIKKFIEELNKKGVPSSKIAVTATTGIAATHINGVTIHSFCGMGIKDEMTDDAVLKLLIKRPKLSEKLNECKVLIIDEISMLHRKQFELASKIISIARQNYGPFGGLQVILIGDFFQLPPVQKKEEGQEPEKNSSRFCFMSDTWVGLDLKICYLTEQYRATDNSLNKILNAIRNQEIENEHMELLQSRFIKPNSEVTHLYTHNINVDYLNSIKLNNIEGESKYFEAEMDGNEHKIKTLKDSMIVSSKIELKLGAKVMFVKNNPDEGYANGTQGIVTNFKNCSEEGLLPIVTTTQGDKIVAHKQTWELTEKDKVVASFKQIPLRLAWAITIHKSQGMTLNEAQINLGRTFEDGQGYVAISRLKSIEGLYLEDINTTALKLNPLTIKADSRFKELSLSHEEALKSQSRKSIDEAIQKYLKELTKKY